MFDKVDHTQLLSSLENIGLRGIPYDLMRSYSSNGERMTLELGVPQGTVSGPIYILKTCCSKT